MTPLDAAILVAYYVILGVLAIYSLHRLHLVRLRKRFSGPAEAVASPKQWPSVCVQLPMFNEPNVAARVIDAAASIEYDGALSIQVLDDSTDETTSIVAVHVSEWRARGVDIAHVRRTSRDGYKAGALAHGMSCSDAELFAIFDADFVPPPQILRAIVPHFQHARVGMVQARWGHLNRTQSLLTRVQAIYLDAHFAIESAARHGGGRFFNFNGTAGVWRRSAIEEAGGWSASTLTEDLDLSYRAQLAGWEFRFLPDVEVPAELPATLSGFQEQQHRWAKGSIQTARNILPRIWRSALPMRVKSEATFHLTNNCAYLLTTLIALLIVPAIVIRQRLGMTATLAVDALLFAMSTGSVMLFYVEGQRYAGRPRPTLRELLALLPAGIAISIRNSAAVLEGLTRGGGHFRRTPKQGDANVAALERRARWPVGELLMSGFFAVAFVTFAAARQWMSLPFLMLFLSGYSWAVALLLSERAFSAP